MNFLIFMLELKKFLPAILIASLFMFAGSYWIDCLYKKALCDESSLLSFPEMIPARAKYRKPLLFLLLLLCIGATWGSIPMPALLYYIVAIVFLCYITITDFEQYVIFDNMLLPFAIFGVCYTLHIQQPLFQHIAAALGGGLSFFLLTLLTKGAIGGGDIKLIATLGLWFGIRPLISVAAYGFIAGGIAAFFLLITKQKNRHDYFAYGPYFALSGIGMLLGWVRILF